VRDGASHLETGTREVASLDLSAAQWKVALHDGFREKPATCLALAGARRIRVLLILVPGLFAWQIAESGNALTLMTGVFSSAALEDRREPTEEDLLEFEEIKKRKARLKDVQRNCHKGPFRRHTSRERHDISRKPYTHRASYAHSQKSS